MFEESKDSKVARGTERHGTGGFRAWMGLGVGVWPFS